jgi:hypothetical protein
LYVLSLLKIIEKSSLKEKILSLKISDFNLNNFDDLVFDKLQKYFLNGNDVKQIIEVFEKEKKVPDYFYFFMEFFPHLFESIKSFLIGRNINFLEFFWDFIFINKVKINYECSCNNIKEHTLFSLFQHVGNREILPEQIGIKISFLFQFYLF